jgi:hypothetical protein
MQLRAVFDNKANGGVNLPNWRGIGSPWRKRIIDANCRVSFCRKNLEITGNLVFAPCDKSAAVDPYYGWQRFFSTDG